MRVLIIDDEPLARKRIRNLLGDEADVQVVGECRNGKEAVESINSIMPDLIFLDVQMPGMDAFGVLERIESGKLPVVVFVTAYDQYAIKAFEVHALDYLLKPFDKERFQKSLLRARSQLQKGEVSATQLAALIEAIRKSESVEERILVKSSGKALFVPVQKIEWIESTGNYVMLHVGSESHLLRETMKGMERRLDSRSFRRVHRHIIVNVNFISELRSWFHGDYKLSLKGGTILTVSRRYRQNLDGAL